MPRRLLLILIAVTGLAACGTPFNSSAGSNGSNDSTNNTSSNNASNNATNNASNNDTSNASNTNTANNQTNNACEPACGPDEVCDEASGVCVSCLDSSDCDDPLVCDPDTNSCVACLVDADCGGDSPACDVATNACVECTDANASACTDGVCDADANSCVECLVNDDCTDPTASRCDVNTCVPCAAADDCGHLPDTTVCDLSAGGECVECTGTQFDVCDGVCDSRLRTCTAQAPGEQGLCEECVSDAQCRDGMLCIPQMFEKSDGTGPAEVGTFCFWREDRPEGPDGDCFNIPPYVDADSATSLDGTTASVCGLNVTTCPALNEYQIDCMTADNPDCGADGFDDGYCVMAGAQTNKCTVPCVGDDDCDLACDSSAIPKLCEL